MTLLMLALLSGVGWRTEVELRAEGWTGLAWLTYFHWAPPVCVGLFIGWVFCFTRVSRPCLFVVALAAFAVVGYVAAEFLLKCGLGSGPRTIFLFLDPAAIEAERLNAKMLMIASPFLWALIPIAFCQLCRAFGFGISVGRQVVSALLFVASWPLAIFVRSAFEDRGGQDLIHALKSGFVIPFLVLSLGLPLLRFSWPTSRHRRASTPSVKEGNPDYLG